MYYYINQITINTREMFLRKLTISITSLMCIQTASLHAESLPGREIEMNYISPFEKTINLQNELRSITTESSPQRASVQSKATPNCYNGTLGLNSGNFNKGWSFRPYPAVKVTMGVFQGQLKVTGRYCGDGTWRATGDGTIKCKNEVSVGINSGDWVYFQNNNYRYKVEFGIKAEANPNLTASVALQGDKWKWSSVQVRAAGQADLSVGFYSPKLTLEQRRFNGVVYEFYGIPITGPTNGQYIDNLACEFSAYGKLTGTYEVNFTVVDHDPDVTSNKEKQWHNGSLVGKAGVKVKFKLKNGPEFETEHYWQRTVVGTATLDSSVTETPVDDATDTEVSRRPTN